jgi:hypothetical protein
LSSFKLDARRPTRGHRLEPQAADPPGRRDAAVKVVVVMLSLLGQTVDLSAVPYIFTITEGDVVDLLIQNTPGTDDMSRSRKSLTEEEKQGLLLCVSGCGVS